MAADRVRRRSDLTPGLRLAALGGVVGPASFVAAWALGGARTDGYSPVEQAISRLAAVDAATAPLMTAGFATFAAGMALYGQALRVVVPGPAWVAATVSGLATLGVAATPLDRSPQIDTAHAVFAVVGYAAVSATPFLAGRQIGRGDARLLGRGGVVAGVVAAASLAMTSIGSADGLFQRLGLTVADAWILASALAVASGRVSCARTRHWPGSGPGQCDELGV